MEGPGCLIPIFVKISVLPSSFFPFFLGGRGEGVILHLKGLVIKYGEGVSRQNQIKNTFCGRKRGLPKLEFTK